MATTTQPIVHDGAESLREVVMGAQDNLTNVLAVVLGVAIGSGEVRTVALAGLAAGIAEAVSMGGVLYTSTRAERDLELERRREAGVTEIEAERGLRDPRRAAAVTFVAALIAASVPLAPFLLFPFGRAMAVSAVVSLGALFALGGWTGTVTHQSRWRASLRFVLIGGLAALGAALVGAALRVDGV